MRDVTRIAQRMVAGAAVWLVLGSLAAAAAAPAPVKVKGKTPAPGLAPTPPKVTGGAPTEPLRPEMPACVRWSVEVLTPKVLTREPVILRITWRNTSKGPIEFPDDQPILVTLTPAEGQGTPRPLWMTRSIQPDLMIPLAAGATVSRKVPLVLGWPPVGETKPPIEFVFPAPGRYRLAVEGDAGPGGLEVTVTAPASDEDRAAHDLWTEDIALCMVGGSGSGGSVPETIGKILAVGPASPYAAYALWIRCASTASQGGFGNLMDAARWCEGLLDRHPAFPLREEAFNSLVGLYAAISRGVLAREAAVEMAREFPQGEFVARLRSKYGNVFETLGARRDVPSAGIPVARAALTLTGLDKVPAGARETLEAYLRAVAEGNFAAADALLARDFIGDDGARPDFFAARWKERRQADTGTMRATVSAAAMSRQYDRAMSLPQGQAWTWRGPLCVVEGALAYEWRQQASASADSMHSTRACWVLYGYPDGKWRLVSETSQTRNYRAGGLAQAIFVTLPRTFVTWRITDGTRERSPYEEIKTRLNLPGQVVDSRTQWINYRIIMGGTGQDEATLWGRVRLLVHSAAGAERWVEQDVALYLVLGSNDQLKIKGLDLKAPPWNQGGPPAPRRPGPGPGVGSP